MKTTISTHPLPRRERFDFWVSTVGRLMGPYDMRSAHADDFSATIHAIEAGPFTVATFEQPALEARLSAKAVRRSGGDGFKLALEVHGSSWFACGDRTGDLMEGDLILLDSELPYSSVMHADRGTALTLSIPRGLLPFPEDALRSVITTPIPGRHGIGALTAHHLRQLMAHADELSPLDAARLSTVTLDLVTSLLSHHLNADPPPVQTPAARRLFEDILAFIQHHLADPRLTPQLVAEAHHMSARTLQRLFSAHHTTPAAWIRARRLDRCRRDLADPRLHDRPVHAVGARWAFPNAAHFSRVFKAAHGVTPEDYRRGRPAHVAYRQASGANGQ